MYTVEEFAQLMNVPAPIAYGFLRFMVCIGIASTTKKEREAGRRGKPTLIYKLNAEALIAFGSSFALRTTVPVSVAV